MKAAPHASRSAPLPRSFRLTCAPERAPRVDALLRAEGWEFEPEPFLPALCRRLVSEPRPLGSSLAARLGLIYIQDRSSMLPPLALAPERGAAVLDMCASPGSKTGLLAGLVGPEGFVLGNEPSRDRLATLRANLHAGNHVWAATCSHEGQNLPLRPGSLDRILLDPPCSGWGTAEKHPRVTTLWKGDRIGSLTGLQRLLLAHAARLLRPGGRLAYSTCTTNDDENEAQLRFAEDELGLRRIPLEPFPGFAWEHHPGGDGALRVDGERSGAQGFFVALLARPADGSGVPGGEDGGALPEEDAPGAAAGGRILPGSSLAGPCFDPDLLPPGDVAVFGEHIRFLPPACAGIPAGCRFQAGLLGRMGKRGFEASPRLRSFLPGADGDAPPAGSPALILDSPAEAEALLSGRGRQTGLPGHEAALWLGNLPLGRIGLKNGRAVAAFR